MLGYPNLGAAVAKFRRIKNPTWEQRQAHGEAVEKAIRSLQRQKLQRVTSSISPRCASGTWCNGGDYADGHADGRVGEAMRKQQRNALLDYPDKERRNRTDEKWITMYINAMKEKHGPKWRMNDETAN